jgi:hypothetical protein
MGCASDWLGRAWGTGVGQGWLLVGGCQSVHDTHTQGGAQLHLTLPVPKPQTGLVWRVLSSCGPVPLSGLAVTGPGVFWPMQAFSCSLEMKVCGMRVVLVGVVVRCRWTDCQTSSARQPATAAATFLLLPPSPAPCWSARRASPSRTAPPAASSCRSASACRCRAGCRTRRGRGGGAPWGGGVVGGVG